jgi:uncharacterized protein YutE (UPF0331/DUF86 family)
LIATCSTGACRNILVHLYLEVDHERLHAALRDELQQVAGFAAAMQRVLDEEKEETQRR